MGKLFDYVAFPLLLPFILVWVAAARVLSLLIPLTVLPTVWLARRLYWAVPFIPGIYAQKVTISWGKTTQPGAGRGSTAHAGCRRGTALRTSLASG